MDKLDDFISISHGVMYTVYSDNYSYDAQCAPVMAILDIEKFAHQLTERMV